MANIDVFELDTWHHYGAAVVMPCYLPHSVPNCGYHIRIGDTRIIYATDTSNISHVVAQDYDLYLVEANYGEAEIIDRIHHKLAAGEYCHEIEVLKSHLSQEACDNWLYQNMGTNSIYVYMHQHRD
jgi:hypothetical protein